MASSYQVIAEVPVADFATLERVQKGLGRSYNLDLSPFRSKLRSGGVCIAERATFAEAEREAQKVRSLGADFRVLDPQGTVVLQGEGRRSPPGMATAPPTPTATAPPTPTATAPRPEDPATLLGGFSPTGAGPGAFTARRPASRPLSSPPSSPHSSRLSSRPSSSASLGVIADASPSASASASKNASTGTGAVTVAAWPSPAVVPPLPSGPSRDPARQKAGPGPSQELALARTLMGSAGSEDAPANRRNEEPDHAFDQLDVDDLVLLDGTTEEKRKPVPRSTSAAPAISEGGSASLSFAPPEEDDLELDAPLRLRVPTPVTDSAALETIDPSPMAPLAADPTAQVEADAGQSPSEVVDAIVFKSEPAQPVSCPLLRTNVPSATRAGGARPGTHARARQGQPAGKRTPLETVLDFVRDRPRIRLIFGFVLSISLGSAIPACHARSVMTSRIQPLLVDLSTAKTHGQLLSRLPNYRSAEEIEAEISSIKVRQSAFTFFLWLCLAGVLCFLWFRFV